MIHIPKFEKGFLTFFFCRSCDVFDFRANISCKLKLQFDNVFLMLILFLVWSYTKFSAQKFKYNTPRLYFFTVLLDFVKSMSILLQCTDINAYLKTKMWFIRAYNYCTLQTVLLFFKYIFNISTFIIRKFL